jgi:cytoskeletal protein CcmA (bactofilin family)
MIGAQIGSGDSMFQKREKSNLPESYRPTGKIETIIGAGISLQGTLTGKGGVRIEGIFEGTINLDGPLVIGEQGRVLAKDIHAPSIVVSGTVQANLFADRVQVLRTGKVWGDVITPNLATEEGGFLKGTIQMPEEPSPNPSE